MRKAFKFRLSPTKQQEQKVSWVLARCRELYNAGLTERRDAYNFHVRHHPNYYDEETRKALTKELTTGYQQQKGTLPEIKAELREEYQDIHSQVLQDVLLRLERAFQNFFRRVREHAEEAGYPRFKSRNRYDSFTYPQGGYSLDVHEKRATVTFSKIGTIKVKLHRKLQGALKTCTVKREVDQWYVIFSCEIAQPEALEAIESEVGIDLGLTHFAALSDGSFMESPRLYRKAQADLRRKQRHFSRCKRRSHRREKARKAVAKAHRKVANQRRDFHHKHARKLVQEHQVIVLEDLQLTNLVRTPKAKQDEVTGQYLPNGAAAKGGLNKSILDAGMGQFVAIVTHKAEEAGRTVAKINPRKTSQLCSQCHKQGPHKDLEERVHICSFCGVVLDRDTNAAINILTAWKRPTLWARLCGKRDQGVEAPCL